MGLVTADNGARAGVTFMLQQLGRDRIDVMQQVAGQAVVEASSDIASDFQVIESHVHAVVAHVQGQRVEEGRLRAQLQARGSARCDV